MPTNHLKSSIQLDLSVAPHSPKYSGVTEGKWLLVCHSKYICKTEQKTPHCPVMFFGPEIMIPAKDSVPACRVNFSSVGLSLKGF